MLIVAMLMFGIFYGTTQTAAQESDAPFLYYYSSEDQAIVVERADGSDRRLLGKGLILGGDDYAYHVNTQWTPSGEWLMVWEMQDGELTQSVAVRIDGEQVISDVPSGYFPYWSPTRDTYAVIEPIPNTDRSQVTIIDLVSQETILTLEAYRPIEWSDDGDEIRFIAPDNVLVSVGLDGSREEQRILEDTETHINLHDDYLHYRHPEHHTLIFEHIETGELVEYTQFAPHYPLFEWSPNRQNALAYVRNPSDQTCDLWFLSLMTQSAEQIVEGACTTGPPNKWSMDGSWVAVNIQNQWYRLDATTLEREPLLPNERPTILINDYYDFERSVSGRYAASLPRCEYQGVYLGKCFIELEENRASLVPIHSDFQNNYDLYLESGQAFWHFEQDWVIFDEYSTGERMSDLISHTSVAHPLGFYREFNDCSDAFCPIWLPENVPIERVD